MIRASAKILQTRFVHFCLFLFSVSEYQVRSIASHVRPDRQSKWVSLGATQSTCVVVLN